MSDLSPQTPGTEKTLLPKPPSHVTFEGNTPEGSLASAPGRPRSPRGGGASSEEDSVAEMDYISEVSHPFIKEVPTDHDIISNIVPPQIPAPASSMASKNSAVHPVTVPTPSASEGSNPRLSHRPQCLPKFRDPPSCVWTASHAANCPTEDRSASLVNLLLQPLPKDFDDSETQLKPLEPDYQTLIRLNLWCVVDGHGGGCVATYASEVLLPHIAASVSRALNCAIVDRGVCTVNGQLRDANALDLDGLITTSTNNRLSNPNSIQYRAPFERGAEAGDEATVPQTAGEQKQLESLAVREAEAAKGKDSIASEGEASSVKTSMKTTESPGGTLLGAHSSASVGEASSVKTSVKTAASPAGALLGTHSPREVAAITRAITESFLAVDEGWINSIDPVSTHQNSCQSNGRWNSGACALVVFTVQRLDWTSVSQPDPEKELWGPEKNRTTQNRDAARRRMLDNATRTKSSTMSIGSSTSSLTTEEAVNASGLESEITETEGEDAPCTETRRRDQALSQARFVPKKEAIICGGCSCHCYKAHDAILYTAHVGDCRAVMLGSAPPRTIKVRDSTHPDTTDDESSHHSSDETECLSSSDHEADSSEEEDVKPKPEGSSAASAAAFNLPRRVARQKSRLRADDTTGPFIALPPLADKPDGTPQPVEVDLDTEVFRSERKGKEPSDSSSSSSRDSQELVNLIHLPPVTRPIDLTTDHSAYNPAEVTAVLRRCNNAPRAISAGVGGGIKRVAGSLAVTRALGDAYLKTPLLSFNPYKSHAPYITARPEVNCRPVVKDGDKVLILGTDGVWERATGEDCLRWVRNFFQERFAEAERRNNRRSNLTEKVAATEVDTATKNAQEGAERELFERSEFPRKREIGQNSAAPAKRRKRNRPYRMNYNVADVIVRRVLNKVRRARNISSLQALMTLPPGRARRSKHDDITASVVDLSAFVS